MTKLTINAKGRVTLKQELLKHLGVAPGEKIEGETLPYGRIVVRVAAHEGKIADFIGCLSQKGGSRLTIDEMNEAQPLLLEWPTVMPEGKNSHLTELIPGANQPSQKTACWAESERN